MTPESIRHRGSLVEVRLSPKQNRNKSANLERGGGKAANKGAAKMKQHLPIESPYSNQLGERPLRALVVEDHADMSIALKVFFRLLGYQAWFAVDVASALRIAGEEFYDILLSDIRLPDGDGWELRRRLVEAGRCPPHSIAMSGFGAAAHAVRSREAGYALHLIKPINPEVLMRALDHSIPVPAQAPPPISKRKLRFKKRPLKPQVVAAGFAA